MANILKLDASPILSNPNPSGLNFQVEVLYFNWTGFLFPLHQFQSKNNTDVPIRLPENVIGCMAVLHFFIFIFFQK